MTSRPRLETPASSEDPAPPGMLPRELGVLGAAMMGLGSMLGTGVFVSIGIAAGIAGPAAIPGIVLAAAVATFNGLSSAQLAASHPVSGGTYEYGYRYLRPWLGFTAGWMFLCAKSASAATAALGFAGYLLDLVGHGRFGLGLRVAVAAAASLAVTGLVLSGIRRSSRFNTAVVSFTIFSLLAFVACGIPAALSRGAENLRRFEGTGGATDPVGSFFHAAALLFVAYTGYGRIATLGEEVREPRSTIPRAIAATLWASAALYAAVATVAVAAVGGEALGAMAESQAAPLETAARSFPVPEVRWLVAAGAMTAMLGVLLNLILGLSRVLLAMGRRGDMPAPLGRLNVSGTAPTAAVLAVGGVVTALTLLGNVRVTWSFSAFTVLIYYALTNLAALALPAPERLHGRWVAWAGLFSCLFLAFWVEWWIWCAGLALIAVGLAWHRMASGGRRGPGKEGGRST